MKAAAAMSSVGPMIERLLRQIARATEPRFISPSPARRTAVLTPHACKLRNYSQSDTSYQSLMRGDYG